MADISANISKSLQGMSNIPVGDLAAGIQQFSDAVKASQETLNNNNVTGKQYNQILKTQAAQNAKFIKDEKKQYAQEKKRYKEENTLWQRATRQNKEHLKVQKSMISGMTIANRELTKFGRAQAKLMGGMQKAASGLGGGITKLAGKAGALGAVVLGLKMIVDRVLLIDDSLISMSKRFGQTKDVLRTVTDEAREFGIQLALTGTSTKEIISMTSSIMDNLSRSTKETRRLAGVATLVAKSFNIAEDVAGKFFARLAESTTMTAEQTEKIFENMAATGRVGINVGRAVRDLATNSTLIAVQGEKQVKNLAQMALYASGAGTDMDKLVKTIRGFSTMEGAVETSQELALAFGIQVEASEKFGVAQRNNAAEMTASYDVLLKKLQLAIKDQDGLTLFQQQALDKLGITYDQLTNKQIAQSVAELKAAQDVIDARVKLGKLVTEQQGIFKRLQTVIFGPLNTLLDAAAAFLESGAGSWLKDLEADMLKAFDGKTLSTQLEKGNWTGALKTAMEPLTNILISVFQDALDWFMRNYEWSLFDGLQKKHHKTTEEVTKGTTSGVNLFPGQGREGNFATGGEWATLQEAADFANIGGEALGGIGGRRTALVGEAGGEVVVSRSALRSGIGVGGRAASALAGIGVPGFANGFTSTYRADTSGTRDSSSTWMSGRGVRGQHGAAASTAQNAPLREFQESVYQFRLSSIEYGEASRANVQQMRRLPPLLIDAINMGIKNIGGALMGKSGSSMMKFSGGGETMKYMNMFNQMGIGKSLGFAAKGKYVNSPTLMMVGEENRGEVVIPTERIRKGLPINKGVANELGSIGVPGFGTGADDIRARSAAAFDTLSTSESTGGIVNMTAAETKAFRARASGTATPKVSTVSPSPSPSPNSNFDLEWSEAPALQSLAEMDKQYISTENVMGSTIGAHTQAQPGPGRYGKGSAFADAGGWGGAGRMAVGGAAMGGLSAAFNTWQQGGTSDQVMASGLTSALSGGVGLGATALLTPVLGPFAPMVGGMIGSVVGKYAGPWISKKMGADDPKFGKYRKQAMRLMKTHVKNRMPFEPGIPHGLGKAMTMGIGGRFGKPTNKSQADMRNDLMKNFPNLSNREAIGFTNMMLGGESNPKAYSYFNKDFGLPQAMQFAKGGVVNRPTNAIIGEAGPEAVIPLENSELVKEMREIRKATQQLVKIIGDGKTTINLDGRVLAESTGLQMYDIANGL